MVEGKDLRKAGLKVTLPRLKILEILEGSQTRHMSAEEIYKKLLDSSEDIGLATVYRVLTQFESAGLVSRHHFEDGMAVFGLVEEFVDAEIETRQNAIAQRLGFKIEEHSLVLYGRCQRQNCPSRKLARNRMHLSRAPS